MKAPNTLHLIQQLPNSYSFDEFDKLCFSAGVEIVDFNSYIVTPTSKKAGSFDQGHIIVKLYNSNLDFRQLLNKCCADYEDWSFMFHCSNGENLYFTGFILSTEHNIDTSAISFKMSISSDIYSKPEMKQLPKRVRDW